MLLRPVEIIYYYHESTDSPYFKAMTEDRCVLLSLRFFTITLIQEDKNYAYHYFTDNSKSFMGCYYAIDSVNHGTDSMTGKEDQNDKLNITHKDILSILLAAAATALCILIDVVSKESEIGSDNQTEGEE